MNRKMMLSATAAMSAFAAFVAFAVLSAGTAMAHDAIKAVRGAGRLTDIRAIPVLDPGARMGYVGSIDPSGGNADWNWGEVQDENGEWILFEDVGAGCVFNFTQHRGETAEIPVFRFYFDGEAKPRLEVRPRDFGGCATLPEPLAGALCINDRSKRPFRIVRSFVPMEYRQGCKITSSIALRGTPPEGGWGHVMFHHYDSLIAEARAAVAAKDDERAIAAYEKALRVRPEMLGVYRSLGAIYEAERDWESALVTYRRSLEAEYNQPDMWDAEKSMMKKLGIAK